MKTEETVSLEQALRDQATSAEVPPGLDALISIDAGPRARFSVRLADDRMKVRRGLSEKATLRILTHPDVLTAVVTGKRSGVEAFLKGDLRVRGNLALSLRLDSILRPTGRPKRWPVYRTARADGVRTAYLEAGSGHPVVLLHGLGATNASMLPTLWDLARDHRVVAPDLPGFGDSGKPVRSYTPAFFARWLRSFLDHLDLERPHLVGNSMGGRISIEAGLRYPKRLGRIVLLAPSPAFIKGREFVRLVRILRPELALVPLLRIPHRQVVRGIRGMFSDPDCLPVEWYEAAADEFLRVFTGARGRVAFFSAARQIYLEEPHGEHGFWDRLPKLRTPTLFVWGADDRLVPQRFAPYVEKALPNATSVVLEHCGHVPQFELPKETNALIRRFLDEA